MWPNTSGLRVRRVQLPASHVPVRFYETVGIGTAHYFVFAIEHPISSVEQAKLVVLDAIVAAALRMLNVCFAFCNG
jgi:hypothetical protein